MCGGAGQQLIDAISRADRDPALILQDLDEYVTRKERFIDDNELAAAVEFPFLEARIESVIALLGEVDEREAELAGLGTAYRPQLPSPIV